jgi:hypothetical protein
MTDAKKIKALNDAARATFTGCRVMLTTGVQSLQGIGGLLEQVQKFDSFSADNDPYGEHDFGSLRFSGQTVFWKFDYYDVDLQMASPDASDPTVTIRVLTIQLGEEY